jgi:hypothetical protein
MSSHIVTLAVYTEAIAIDIGRARLASTSAAGTGEIHWAIVIGSARIGLASMTRGTMLPALAIGIGHASRRAFRSPTTACRLNTNRRGILLRAFSIRKTRVWRFETCSTQRRSIRR